MIERYRTITEPADVPDDLLKAAEVIEEGWYADAPKVDWEDVLERLERSYMFPDGVRLDLGGTVNSPAINKIKAHLYRVRKERLA